MVKSRIYAKFWLSACAIFLAAGYSQATVRFVATTGNDGNPCSRTAPCRTLQEAHDKSASGDEVQVLNSGEFGPTLSITKSITISAVGVSASMHKPNFTGSVITISNASAEVVLRGLHLSGRSSSAFSGVGLAIDEAAAVHIDQCIIERFFFGGISVGASSPLFLSIRNSEVRHNGSAGINSTGADVAMTVHNSLVEGNPGGIQLFGGRALVSRTVLSANTNGLRVDDDARAAVTRTVSTMNTGNGFFVDDGHLFVDHSAAAGNATSAGSPANLQVESSDAFATISDSEFVNASQALRNEGGTIFTRGNNTVNGFIFSTLTPIAAQ
jgi:hypothetical protein